MRFKSLKYLSLIISAIAFSSQALAAKLNSNFSKTSLKTTETFTVTYTFINDKNRRLLITDPLLVGKQITLKKYFLSDCSDTGFQVGDKLDPSVAASSTYSITESGLFYLKPEVNIPGYSGACSQISIFGVDIPFEKLSASLTGISSSGSNILLSWQDLNGNVAVNSTQKATVSVYSSSSCLQKITGSRVSTLAPTKGESSALITVPAGVSSAFIQASSGTILSNCLSISKIVAQPATPGQTTPAALTCPDGFVAYSGQCKQFIVACTIPNGKGNQTFNISTGKYNQCVPSSCSAGYIVNGNSCILQSVAQTLPSPTPSPVVQACTVADVANSSSVSGNKPNCSATACANTSLYFLSNGACSPVDCSVANANIANAASVSGTLVSGCSLVSCAAGYNKSVDGKSCILAPQACTVADVPNSSAVSGNRPSCSATACTNPSLYSLSNGACSPISCSVANANIPNAASVSGTLVSGCNLVSCATGYDKSANETSCVLAPQVCTVADVPNSVTVSGNKPNCSATFCIRNYTVQNGACVVTGAPKIQAKVVSGGMYYKNTNGNFSIISTTGNAGALKKVSGSNFTIKTDISN